MKKIISALAFTAVLFLNIGCSSDDSSTIEPPFLPPPVEVPTPTTQELLIGTWQIQEEGEIIDGVKKAYTISECTSTDTYEFTKELKYINKYHEENEANTCNEFVENGSWTLIDKVLKMTYLDEQDPELNETYNIRINEISTTKLELEELSNENEATTYYVILSRASTFPVISK